MTKLSSSSSTQLNFPLGFSTLTTPRHRECFPFGSPDGTTLPGAPPDDGIPSFSPPIGSTMFGRPVLIDDVLMGGNETRCASDSPGYVPSALCRGPRRWGARFETGCGDSPDADSHSEGLGSDWIAEYQSEAVVDRDVVCLRKSMEADELGRIRLGNGLRGLIWAMAFEIRTGNR